jgi:dihydrofolate synthase/folylpolyglutamate synthase
LNALFAYTILEDLNVQQLVTGSLGRAKCGIEAVSIPGRMDLKYITRAQGGGIRCVLDGAHTPASAALLAENLRTLGATGITLLIGVVDGKDAKGILTQFANIVDHVIITPPGSFKKSSPSTLVETCQELHIPYQVVDQAGDALNQGVATTENSGTLLCTGSFYLLGEISPLLDALAEKITPEVV